jgi:hypothetical protein
MIRDLYIKKYGFRNINVLRRDDISHINFKDQKIKIYLSIIGIEAIYIILKEKILYI